MNTFRCLWRINHLIQYQQIRLGHRVRGKPPIYCRTIKERIDELNYKDELYTTRIDIGFPSEKKTPTKTRQERMDSSKNIKNDKKLEELARKCMLEIDMEQSRKDWLQSLGPLHKKQIADHYGVFEHLYGEGFFIPHLNLDVLYDIKDGNYLPVYYGNVIKPAEALESPTVTYESDGNSLWTLALTNLDGHLTDNDKEYVHWLVANIPGNSVEKGDIIAEYLRPFPLKGTGYHRYVFVLYKQDGRVSYDLPTSLGSVERHYSRVSYGRDSDSTPTLQKPTIKVKDIVKIDNELEERKIKEAFGDETSYEEDSEDFKKVFDIEAPVKLPMDDGGWSNNHTKAAVKIKQEVVVKQEPTDDVDCALPMVDEKPLPDVKELFEDTNVANLLRSDKPALILLQLSDTLPGRGGGGEDDPGRKQGQPSTSGDSEETPVDNRCRLKDLEEGKIGKLRVHKSGRVTLLLGDTVFEVCSGTKASFHQEVVSAAVDAASRSASLVSLGPLQHKLNVTPHWQAMFDNMSV